MTLSDRLNPWPHELSSGAVAGKKDLLDADPNGDRKIVQRKVIGVGAKRVFYLLGEDLEATQHIKKKGGKECGPIAKFRDKEKGQRHDIGEDEFLDEEVIGIGYRRFLDALATTTDLRELGEGGIKEEDVLKAQFTPAPKA